MIYSWSVLQVSDNEYHVLEDGPMYQTKYVLARCSGPTPAYEIQRAMTFAHRAKLAKDSIVNCTESIKDALKGLETAGIK